VHFGLGGFVNVKVNVKENLGSGWRGVPAKSRSREGVFLPQRRGDAEGWPRRSAALQKLVAVGMVSLLGILSSGAWAQVTVTRSWNMGTNGVISDRGQYVSAIAVADAGLSSITAASATVNLSSVDNSRPMVLGHYVGTLTHGTASENERMAYLFNRPNSTASSLSATYNFSGDFDGEWLASNTWSLLVADQVKGAGAAKLDSWNLSVTGAAQAGATVALGNDGEVSVAAGTSSVATVYAASAGSTSRLRPQAGAVLDFSAGGGGLSGEGNFQQVGGGRVILGGANNLTGTYQVRDAGSSVKLTSNDALGSAAGIDLGAGTKLELGNGVSLSRTVTVAANQTAQLETASDTTATVTAAALNGVDGTLEKRGTGTTVFSGTTSGFDGTLAVREGAVKVDAGASLGASSTVSVARESFDPATDARVTISGTGTVGALEVGLGGAIGPGNSPGQLNAGNTTWGVGGAYEWEINDFLGSAGENWDFLNITGELAITATSESRFLIDVISLLADNSGGDALNFDPYANLSFAIATASGGITGFDVAKFTLSTANFSNDFYDGVWSLSTSAGGGGAMSLLVNYAGATAIPEPNSASLMLLGLGVAYLRRRRRG
jgi:autotransporter-associated beta strand protein